MRAISEVMLDKGMFQGYGSKDWGKFK